MLKAGADEMSNPGARVLFISRSFLCVITLMVVLSENGSAQTVLIGPNVQHGDLNEDMSVYD